jgi:glutamate--cysteine ligase
VPKVLDQDFGYAEYATYLLSKPVIFLMEGEKFRYTREQPLKEVFDPKKIPLAELEHVMTMVFPDVRVKKYLEIRMTDAVPYPLNFSVIALWKSILYNDENLAKLEKMLSTINNQDIVESKKECIAKGLKATLAGQKVLDVARDIVALAEEGLEPGEKSYLLPLQSLVLQGKSPAQLTKEKLYLGKQAALAWCVLK